MYYCWYVWILLLLLWIFYGEGFVLVGRICLVLGLVVFWLVFVIWEGGKVFVIVIVVVVIGGWCILMLFLEDVDIFGVSCIYLFIVLILLLCVMVEV